MIVLCILLVMLSLFLFLKLIYQRKLVRKIKKQIDFLTDRDTQTEIMVEKNGWANTGFGCKYQSSSRKISRYEAGNRTERHPVPGYYYQSVPRLANAAGNSKRLYPALTGTGFNRGAKRICNDCGRTNFRCKTASRPTV